MPKMSLSIPPRTVPSGEVRATVRAAGAVPTTGAPQASYPAGTYDFETHILIAQALPVVNRGAFPGRLAETLRDADTNVGTTTAATISISAPTPPSDAERTAIARAWNIDPVGNVNAWYSISGRFTAPSTWTVANLNRAIARAFANTATFPTTMGTPAATAKLPRQGDGSALLTALSAPGACTGARDYAKVFAAACTRVGNASTLRPTTQGTADYTKSPTGPVMTPTTQGTANYTKPATSTPSTTARPSSSSPPAPAVRPESSIQVRPTPVSIVQPPPPSAPIGTQTPQESNTGTYLAVGGVAVAAGLAIWKRRAIAAWFRS